MYTNCKDLEKCLKSTQVHPGATWEQPQRLLGKQFRGHLALGLFPAFQLTDAPELSECTLETPKEKISFPDVYVVTTATGSAR